MRLIDADALMADIERTIENSGCVNHEGEIMDCVRYAPEVDAMPVVRCGECRYRELAKVNCKGYTICPASGMEITDDDFCSYGERKEPPKGE
jgi:hypothetical protein